jgi:hypothetical protein
LRTETRNLANRSCTQMMLAAVPPSGSGGAYDNIFFDLLYVALCYYYFFFSETRELKEPELLDPGSSEQPTNAEVQDNWAGRWVPGKDCCWG